MKPSVRDAAREAARRHGISVGEWLNAAIAETAHEPAPYQPDYAGGFASAPDPRGLYQNTVERSPIADIHARLDAITQQIDRISPRQAAPRPPVRDLGGNALARQLSEAISRIDRQLDSLSAKAAAPAQVPAQPAMPSDAGESGEFERMVAEFGARRGELNGQPVPPGPAALTSQPATENMPPPAQPAIDLSGLERQLRHITSRIESLPQAGPLDAAIASFREELADIRQSITGALPRRAVEAIEQEIRALAHRIDNSRQCGADKTALAAIEQALGEILTVVRGLTSAEQLAGYDKAIRNLSDKIDVIVRDGRDRGAIDQLEAAIATLKDIAARVASNETLGQLRLDIQHLAEKVANIPQVSDESASLLGALEQRIAVLTEALETRQPAAPDFSRMEGAMQALTSRIDQFQPPIAPEADPSAYLRLEQRIVELLGRIDASSSQFERFGEIERNLNGILTQIERQREAVEAAMRRSAAMDAPDLGDMLRREISDLRFSQSEAERRMQDSLETVHNTLGHVVDRLSQIEGDLRNQRGTSAAAPSLRSTTQPLPPIMPAAERIAASAKDGPIPPMPAALRPSLSNPAAESFRPAPPPSASSAEQRSQWAAGWVESAIADDAPLAPNLPGSPPAMGPVSGEAAAPAKAEPRAARPAPVPRRPIDESLPPDYPIEPGSRTISKAGGTAAERIAASEAALESAPRDNAAPSPAANPSSFIAAARRAAKSAAGQSAPRKQAKAPAIAKPGMAKPVIALDDGAEDTSARTKSTFSSKLRQLLVGASVVVIVLGTLRIGMNLFSGGSEPAPSPPAAAEKSSAIMPPLESKALADLESRAKRMSEAASSLLDRPSVLPPPTAENPTAPSSGSLAMPASPAAAEPDSTATTDTRPRTPDVTGSVGAKKVAAITSDNVDADDTAAPRMAPVSGTLPESIGNTALRSAALGGNAAAAFEIAQRYGEGKGIPVSYPDSAIWYERAAKAGVVPAMFRIGSLYEKGLGVTKDLSRARDYYVMAAERGNAKSMHNLAVLFADGGGKGPDYANATKWFRKAADHGLADSQYNLGILYARGIGVPQNLAESYKWFSLAAAQGDADAGRKRDDVAKRLDAQSLTAARLAVQTFAPETQPDVAVNVSGLRKEWQQRGSDGEAKATPRKPAPAGKSAARPSADASAQAAR